MPLPPQDSILRYSKMTIFGVYRRIFLLVFLVNGFFAYHIFKSEGQSIPNPLISISISTMASTNKLIAILIRQDYILINPFKLSWCTPFSTPLLICRSIAKTYEYGGLHSGAAVCSTLWFSVFAWYLTAELIAAQVIGPLVLFNTFTILSLSWTILLTAYPLFRFKEHDIFEFVHRCGGGLTILLFWPGLYLFTQVLRTRSPYTSISDLHAFGIHLSSTLHTLLPCLRLRRLRMHPQYTGNGARTTMRLQFMEDVPNCVVYKIVESLFKQWHSFACIPSSTGGSLIVANAGDWTGRLIRTPLE